MHEKPIPLSIGERLCQANLAMLFDAAAHDGDVLTMADLLARVGIDVDRQALTKGTIKIVEPEP